MRKGGGEVRGRSLEHLSLPPLTRGVKAQSPAFRGVQFGGNHTEAGFFPFSRTKLLRHSGLLNHFTLGEMDQGMVLPPMV